MNTIHPKILIIGESGCGKNTIQDYLQSLYKLKPLISYTTREKRFPEENTHTFITDREYEELKDDIIAHTFYNNHHYFATAQQFEEADVYIIDMEGLRCLKETCPTPFVSFYIQVSEKTRRERMKERGDSDDKISERLKLDREAFEQAKNECDYILTNENSLYTAAKIYHTLYETPKYEVPDVEI